MNELQTCTCTGSLLFIKRIDPHAVSKKKKKTYICTRDFQTRIFSREGFRKIRLQSLIGVLFLYQLFKRSHSFFLIVFYVYKHTVIINLRTLVNW